MRVDIARSTQPARETLSYTKNYHVSKHLEPECFDACTFLIRFPQAECRSSPAPAFPLAASTYQRFSTHFSTNRRPLPLISLSRL